MKFDHCQECRYQAIGYAIFMNTFLVVFKACLAWLSGSAALMADAFHSSADVIASTITMLSLRFASRPADAEHAYGHGKIQFISSALVGLILVVGATTLLLSSANNVLSGHYETPERIAMFGALVSVIMNEMLFRYQMCVYAELNSPAIMADAWDNRSDAITSVGVFIGLGFATFGFPIVDALTACIVSLMVIKIGLELCLSSIKGLMDSAPEEDELKDIYKIAKEMPGVLGVGTLRARTVGEALFVEIDVVVDGALKVYEGDLIVEMLKEKILRGVENVQEVQVLLTPEIIDLKAKEVGDGRIAAWLRKSMAVFRRQWPSG
ncbi:MAG: magnetosome biogenesis CDF transporter MamB [Magnetococcales bacterium]|nr:magnetosome biogenesis CDF transporter MamB [Magnetococcales bacterium]NGZ26852.1 magnetosome biogenesis CDF transporter MamB [Magnetococcales bacterium]